MSMNDQKKLEQLASDYFLRDLDDAELKRLEDELAENPELGDYFVEAARDEWLMSHHQSEQEKTIRFVGMKHKPQRKIKRIAAGIAVFLTLGAVLVSQHMEIQHQKKLASAKEIHRTLVASVSDISVFEGDAISVVNSGRVRSLTVGDDLYDGDRVVIPTGGSLTYQYAGEETSVKMGSGTLFAISDDDGAKRIHITRGRMNATVAKQRVGKPMKISSHDAEAVVLGTTLEVLVDQFTRLSVDEGLVRFITRADNKSVDVAGGNSVISQEPELNVASQSRTLYPVQEANPGFQYWKDLLHVSPKKGHEAFLKFDLSGVDGAVEEARLRLRIVKRVNDAGGGGHIRLFSVPADTLPADVLKARRTMITEFKGQVERDTNLDFVIDPSDLESGMNSLVIALDRQGSDDFWFSSSRSTVAPQLMLKVHREE